MAICAMVSLRRVAEMCKKITDLANSSTGSKESCVGVLAGSIYNVFIVVLVHTDFDHDA